MLPSRNSHAIRTLPLHNLPPFLRRPHTAARLSHAALTPPSRHPHAAPTQPQLCCNAASTLPHHRLQQTQQPEPRNATPQHAALNPALSCCCSASSTPPQNRTNAAATRHLTLRRCMPLHTIPPVPTALSASQPPPPFQLLSLPLYDHLTYYSLQTTSSPALLSARLPLSLHANALVWRMRVGIDSPLSSISEFSMDLKRIQTPHNLAQAVPTPPSYGRHTADLCQRPCRPAPR